jgi:hypothetical protein
MALGFIQSLVEMSTRRSFWSKAQPARKGDILNASNEPVV